MSYLSQTPAPQDSRQHNRAPQSSFTIHLASNHFIPFILSFNPSTLFYF